MGIAEKRAVTQDDVEATRQWLARQSPEAADRQLGEALGRASMEGGDAGFATVAALAVEQPRNDDFLVSFLENANASGHAAGARRLADKISDPVNRAKILVSLAD